MANLYLNGALALTFGQNVSYAQALNSALTNVNSYWHGQSLSSSANCSDAAGVFEPAEQQDGQQVEVAKGTTKNLSPFILAPNPAGSFVTISLEPLDEEQEAVLEIYNHFGQLMLRKDFGVVGQLNERVDLRRFQAGFYIVSLKVGGERFEQRMFVDKG